MKIKTLTVIVTVGLLTTSSFGYNNELYENNYGQKEGFEKYRVVSSTPITNTITKRIRIGDEIRDKVVRRKVPCSNERETNSIGLDTILGTTIGIAIGNQVGRGNGRDAAKVIGGLGGGYIANQMRNKGNDCFEESVVQEYIPKYETITDNVIVGYNNCVEVDGKKLCKESKNRKKFLKVKKTYSIY